MPATIGSPLMWIGFGAFVVAATIVDLYLLRSRGDRPVPMRQALAWSAVWVALAAAFAAWLWWHLDATAGRALTNAKTGEFVTGYLLEKSLAVDNIFVFLMLFTYFAVPAALAKRVLVLGVIGAIVLRTAMILVGAWLIATFHWTLYLFGVFLLATGVKMWFAAGKPPDLGVNPVLCGMRGRLAIGGGFRERFGVFGVGLAPIPLFVGTEMLLDDLVKTPVAASLAIVAAILAASIAASLLTRPPASARGRMNDNHPLTRRTL